MARYGAEFGGRSGADSGRFGSRGAPGTWTHFGSGHGRGGGIDPEDAWRANRDDFRDAHRGSPGGGGSRGGYHPSHGIANQQADWGGARGRGGEIGNGGRIRAAEIMTENPEAVTPDASVAEVARRMRELDVGIIPVVESEQNRRLKGVVTDRDLAIRVLAEGKDGNATVSDCMTTGVETVNKNDSVRDVLRVMQREQVRRVPVVDRENRLVGIIAQADLAVEYGADDPERESRVAEAIERISEPARPERGRGGWR